ncbi:MAG TPA: endonuclease/exonuclease/phosphatase family protein [Casimicrobiaceae bacterium]|jgi:endonuclease/exonuclease/phosphatase family metal-dependent hydrolase
MNSSTITVATYNIHGAIGSDGSYAPERIAAVLAEIDADIIALQEVGARHHDVDTLTRLQEATGLHAVAEPPRWRAAGIHGNCVLSRHPIPECTHIDLTYPRREARSALDVVIDCDGAPLRVLATHLGLRPAERRAQVHRLLKVLEAETPHPTLLMGDLNEWFLWGRPLRWLHAHFRATPSPRSFPARAPLLALDRIWVEPRALLQRLWAHATPTARAASDHIPVVATIALPLSPPKLAMSPPVLQPNQQSADSVAAGIRAALASSMPAPPG